MNIFNNCFKNKFSYEEIKSVSKINLLDDYEYDINVIVGFRNRSQFLQPLINSFKSAIDFCNKKICLTFIEHDIEPRHEPLLSNVVNYIWTPGNVVSQYSRSFAYNFGVKYSNKAAYYLLHDVDILVKDNFFLELEKNLNNYQCLQPYGNRHLLYMSKNLTEKIISGKLNVNQLNGSDELSAPEIIGSKGGSILVSRDIFFRIGGFDPEIFWGYAAEDQVFWDKVSTVTKIGYSDNPSIDMFHMWHEQMAFTNPLLGMMDNYMHEFRLMDYNNKISFLNLKKYYLDN